MSETFHCLIGITVYTPKNLLSYHGSSKKRIKMPSANESALKEDIPMVPVTNSNFEEIKKKSF